MSAYVLQAVQQALYTKLTGDSLLMDLVAGVYDMVPQEALVPYIVIGDGQAEDIPQIQGSVCECTMALHVWTQGGGRKTALAVLNRLHALLHHGSLSLSGLTLLAMRGVSAETQVDGENDRIYGLLQLAITVRG
jgi:hypothetical protein